MTIKEKIEEIIKTEPIVKHAYEKNDGCFKNTIMPVIENSIDDDDGLLYDLVTVLALQCEMYDAVINNIAIFGNETLIKKCRTDLNTILNSIKGD